MKRNVFEIDHPLSISPHCWEISTRPFYPHLGAAVDETRCQIALEAVTNILQALLGKREIYQIP